jgi:hypothetical protein
VHHAYSKRAEVTVPSFDDWEKDWENSLQHAMPVNLLPAVFRLTPLAISEAN